MSLFSTVNFELSQVISFDFNQLKNLKLSPFFKNPTLQTKRLNFPLVSHGLHMKLACFLSEFSLTNSSPTTQLIMRNFSSFFMKLKTLRQEQNTKYYLPSSKRTSCCRKLFSHIWPKRAKKKAIMFLENFSFDFPKNSLKGELL